MSSIANQNGAMRLARLIRGLTKSRGVRTYRLDARSPAARIISAILIPQYNVVGVSISSGLCRQKKKVFKEQNINANVESSKVERARCCAQRPKA